MDFFKRVMKSLIIFLLCLLPSLVKGQAHTVRLSDSDVLIGDVFTLEYRIVGAEEFPEALSSSDIFPSRVLTADTVEQSIDTGLVEIVGVHDSLYSSDEGAICTRTYKLIAWDSCALALLGFEYSAADSTFHFPPCFLNVSYHPDIEGGEIKDIIEQFHDWKSDRNSKGGSKMGWLVYAIAGLLVLLVIGVFLFNWFRKRRAQKTQSTLEERTIEKIKGLENLELWKRGELKEHVVRYSQILREYLSERYGVSFLDKTTKQSTLLLDSLHLEGSLKGKIGDLLNHSDLVKFARSSMDDKQIYMMFDDLRSVVITTRPEPEEK